VRNERGGDLVEVPISIEVKTPIDSLEESCNLVVPTSGTDQADGDEQFDGDDLPDYIELDESESERVLLSGEAQGEPREPDIASVDAPLDDEEREIEHSIVSTRQAPIAHAKLDSSRSTNEDEVNKLHAERDSLISSGVYSPRDRIIMELDQAIARTAQV